MNIAIECQVTECGRFYTLSTDKHVMDIAVCRHYVRACFHGAASNLNRHLGGKVFHGDTTTERLVGALAGYKSGHAKEMIRTVIDAESKIASV